MDNVVNDATVSVQALLVVANTFLTILAGFFLREFVADVRKLTEEFNKMKRNMAVLATVIRREIDNAIQLEE